MAFMAEGWGHWGFPRPTPHAHSRRGAGVAAGQGGPTLGQLNSLKVGGGEAQLAVLQVNEHGAHRPPGAQGLALAGRIGGTGDLIPYTYKLEGAAGCSGAPGCQQGRLPYPGHLGTSHCPHSPGPLYMARAAPHTTMPTQGGLPWRLTLPLPHPHSPGPLCMAWGSPHTTEPTQGYLGDVQTLELRALGLDDHRPQTQP